MADDVIVCTASDQELSFRLTASGNANDPVVTVEFPTGINYIPGTATIVQSNTASPVTLAENSTGSMTAEFTVGGSFAVGEFVVISLDRIANCEAPVAGGNQDAVYTGTNAADATLSNNYDVLAANLSIVSSAPVTTSVGSQEVVSGSITNGGNGCVNSFELTVMVAPGLFTEYITIGGDTVIPTSVVGNLSVYTITSAEIGGDGCFDGGETLALERGVMIIGCDLGGDGYTVRYGCSDATCQESSFAAQQFNLDFTVPRVRYVDGAVQGSNLCTDAVVEHTFTNQGTGVALNLLYLAGFNSSGTALGGSTGDRANFPVTEVLVDGVSVPFTLISGIAGMEVDLSALTAAIPGSDLRDLDMDGEFDDLPAGGSFMVTLIHTPLPETSCPADRSNSRYNVATQYDDQCEEAVAQFAQNASGSLSDITSDSKGAIIGPADIFDMDNVEVEICGGHRIEGSMVDCPTNELNLVSDLPPGFTLTAATADGQPAQNVESRNDSVFVTIPFQDRRIICFTLNFDFSCQTWLDAGTNDLDFSFNFIYECDADAGCDATREIFSCPIYSPNIHCGDCVAGGLTTRRTTAVRLTTGFATPLDCETTADIADLSELQLKRAMPCDTVSIYAPGVQIGGTSGPTWPNAYFHVEYDPVAGTATNSFSYATGMVEVYEAATGNRSSCPLPAPVEQTTDNPGTDDDLHVMDFDLTGCLGALPGQMLRAGDSVNVTLLVTVDETSDYNDDVPTQLEDVKIFHYNLVDTTTPADMVLDTVRCDQYGLELYLHEPRSGGGGGLTNRQVQG